MRHHNENIISLTKDLIPNIRYNALKTKLTVFQVLKVSILLIMFSSIQYIFRRYSDCGKWKFSYQFKKLWNVSNNFKSSKLENEIESKLRDISRRMLAEEDPDISSLAKRIQTSSNLVDLKVA